MQMDKNMNDSYTFDQAYIKHLIDEIQQGKLDPDLLTASETDAIERELKS
jgi:hypothetical protein